ncbi:MAG TPA: bifunctional folylpolyglutamate synthase/dihydrofolate synthase [Candidatus Atribacteria bacterium]|nr:bifunctional folylpolyglutamate synthase/dihydrofolate synthase [Candidatus Atribacteria bacterium]
MCFKSYKDTIDFLFDLQRFGIKLGLENMARMLNAFGNPHQNLKAIHIAGSNGKGSVAAFVAKIFQKAGYRVGLYTSPHLLDFSERIRIQGEPISYDEVIKLTRLIRTKQYEVEKEDGTNGDPTSVTCMTFFEFTTLLAFLFFLKKKVDLAVVEVGMGGRLDATNVLNPLVSVITNISKEHQQYLGKTLAEIAGEKAGIIKKNGILLTAVTQPQIFAKIRSQCQQMGSTLYRLGKHIGVQEKNGGMFDYQGLFTNYKKLKISVLGKYQINNAALAVGVTEILKNQGYQVTENVIREGLLKMKWPGRLEIVNQNPIILLDGAHNLDAIEKLTKELQETFSYRKLFLVMGIMKDKSIKPILKRIVVLGHHIIFTQPKTDRVASPFFLLKAARFLNNNSEVVEDVKQAVQKALSLANKDDLICVTGSLFTIGEARELFFSRVEI